MDIIAEPQKVEPAKGPTVPQSQPIEQVPVVTQTLNDEDVRAAIVAAESQGIDPMTVTVDDMKPVAPQKFLKPDGTVDVEKIQTSTKQLEEGIANKEQALQKTIDDYLAAEAKFRNMPNPEKVAKALPQVNAPVPPPLSPQQLQAQLEADLRADLPGTIANLVDAVVEHRLNQSMQPIASDLDMVRQERISRERRANIASIAERDPRILDPKVFDAVNAKLASEPKLWELKNPHKAAFLEVKEELRLGELSSNGVSQAQPSRLSPVLGGGTPPSVPSSSTPQPQDILANLTKLDLRDRKQESLGDEAVRAFLAKSNRW